MKDDTHPTTRAHAAGSSGPAAHESRLYGSLSRFYDDVIGRFFVPRVTSAIRCLSLPPGARVLEIGVGTGTSLSAYPRHCDVVGIDLSAEMLAEAREKVMRSMWSHVHVEEGDATDLHFAEDAFDYVMAFHVVSVVDAPARLVAEAVRVCRPGGLVTFVNRFRHADSWAGGVEGRLEPLWRHLGWRTLTLTEVFDRQPLEVLEMRRGGPLGIFTAVVCRNTKNGARPPT